MTTVETILKSAMRKWCCISNHWVWNKSNTTWGNSGTGTYFTSGTWVLPFRSTLLFRVNAIFVYSFHFFPFLAVHIFRYYLYLHNFHVRWRIASGAGTAKPCAWPELSPSFVRGWYWYIFIDEWLYFVDNFLYFCLVSFANCIQGTSLIDCFWLHPVIFSKHF